MKLILLADFLSKYEISRKIDSLNDKFNSLVDKYIGNGIGASIIVLLFVIIAAVIVGKFSKKQNYSFSSILFFSLLYILGGGFMNMIKNDEIEILEDSVENVKISNRKSSAKSNRQYFYVLFLFLLILFALIYMCITFQLI